MNTSAVLLTVLHLGNHIRLQVQKLEFGLVLMLHSSHLGVVGGIITSILVYSLNHNFISGASRPYKIMKFNFINQNRCNNECSKLNANSSSG